MKISIKNLKLNYGSLNVLKGINCEIRSSESISIVGASGSGKSSLIKCIANIEEGYTCDSYVVSNEDITKLNSKQKREFRLNNFGIIFQDFNLIEDYKVSDNIKIIMKFAKMNYVEEEVLNILEKLEIKELIDKQVGNLSGGQKQRVAIARALLLKPKFILADEPTGALDFNTTNKVFNILLSMAKTENIPLILITHDLNIANLCDTLYELRDGVLTKRNI